jgi:hypothetical protein
VDQSKSFLSKQLDDRSTDIGQRVGELAGDLRLVGEQLRGYGVPPAAAAYVDQGAVLVGQVGRYLVQTDPDRMIVDLEAYTRRQPWVVAGAAALVGFAASRFLKTSGSRYAR